MKLSRNTYLIAILLALFLLSMRISISLPPADRQSWQLDADRMVAGIYAEGERERLILDLHTGKLEFQSPAEPSVFASDPFGRWRLYIGRQNGNAQDRVWELIVTEPDGSETKKQFQFPSTPIVLDENLVIASNDNGLELLDLRTNMLKSKALGLRKLSDHVARALPSRRYLEVLSETSGTSIAPNVFTANLYEINDENEALQLWSIAIENFYAFQIIDDRILLIPSNKKSVDEYLAETGEFVRSTIIPMEIVEILESSATATIRLLDLPMLTLRVEDTNNPTANTRYWTMLSFADGFEKLSLPHDEIAIFKLNNHTTQAGYAHYSGNIVDAIGVIDLKANNVIWSNSIDSNIIEFSNSEAGDRWCIRTDEHGGDSFIVLDAKEGIAIARWAPFRWISWCVPAIIIGFVMCSVALVHDSKLTPHLRWIALLFLSTLYLAPLFAHLLYWNIFDRPVPFHHFIQGHFVGALIASAAWIAWGSGRIVVRLIPLFVVACLVFALSRLTLADMSLTKQAVGSTWLAASLGFPICIGLRLIGVGGPGSSESSPSNASWTIPIRDLFLFSTGIAVLLAVSIPVLKSIETPKGFPPGTKQMIVSAVAMYLAFAWLLFCTLTERNWLAYISVMAIAVCISVSTIYEFATGDVLIYPSFSFEMALFRVAASTLITFYVCLECIFANRIPQPHR